MPNVAICNKTLYNTNETFNAIWSLTRAMLAAGWKYKSSSDAYTGSSKEITGNLVFDKWAIKGGVNLTTVAGQTGTAATVQASNINVVVTGLTGMTANSVGRYLSLSGCTTSTNNGVFRIVAYNSATSVSIFNPAGTFDLSNGAIVWAEQGGGVLASIVANSPNQGIATITGLSGMTAPTTTNRGCVGDRLTIMGSDTPANNGTFIIVAYISATSVVISNTAAVNDSSGAVIWTEMSPTDQVYPSSLYATTGLGSWICLEGVSVLKIPIGTTVPVNYIRGENVTQAATGAAGELLGVVTDVVGGLGYLTILPRISGTGASVNGWSITGSDVIIGGLSGVSITPYASGTAAKFTQQVVFWKNNATTGHMYIQSCDESSESAYQFSNLAISQAGCTISICPGGASSGGNMFPSVGSFVSIGTASTGIASTGSIQLALSTTVTNLGKAHLLVANAIPYSGISADGSFSFIIGNPGTSPGAYLGWTYQRMDDCEEGDVFPHVFIANYNAPNYNSVKTTSPTSAGGTDIFRADILAAVNYTPCSGWRRRGFATLDLFQQFNLCILGSYGSTSIIASNTGSVDKVACTPNTIYVREPIWVISTQLGYKMKKGSTRWMSTTLGANSNDCYDGKRLVQLAGGFAGPLVLGPWDGLTVPINNS